MTDALNIRHRARPQRELHSCADLFRCASSRIIQRLDYRDPGADTKYLRRSQRYRRVHRYPGPTAIIVTLTASNCCEVTTPGRTCSLPYNQSPAIRTPHKCRRAASTETALKLCHSVGHAEFHVQSTRRLHVRVSSRRRRDQPSWTPRRHPARGRRQAVSVRCRARASAVHGAHHGELQAWQRESRQGAPAQPETLS